MTDSGTNRSPALWQNRCLSYSVPPERIAYVAAPAGSTLPPYMTDFSDGSRATWGGTVGALPFPVELAELHKQFQPQTAVQWETLPAPVFLHGLKDSHGRTRLLVVYALANNPRGWWTLLAIACDPIGLGDLAERRRSNTSPTVSDACWPIERSSATLVVFAGQPDMTDSSRFTLHVRINGSKQIVKGALRDDGTVVFTSSTGLTPWGLDRAGPLVLP